MKSREFYLMRDYLTTIRVLRDLLEHKPYRQSIIDIMVLIQELSKRLDKN